MKAHLLIRILILALSFGFATAVATAEDAGTVKNRMAQRQGAVDGLKERGVAGETNRGFLEARGSATAQDQGI
ncbi:MAG: hypothetical protein V4773_05440, partial [Verrucomicrobiota bacterium]